MKHPRFESLGDQYPHSLENRFDRILTKIDELWDRPEIEDYFSDLIIDNRGGRQGFADSGEAGPPFRADAGPAFRPCRATG